MEQTQVQPDSPNLFELLASFKKNDSLDELKKLFPTIVDALKDIQEDISNDIELRQKEHESFVSETKKETQTLFDFVANEIKSTAATNTSVSTPSPTESLSAEKENLAPPPSAVDNKKLTKEQKEAQVVMIGGITLAGVRDLQRKLPIVLKDVIKLLPKITFGKEKEQQGDGGGLIGLFKRMGIGSLLAAGGGIALILGGLAALIKGLETDGPFKGLLKILSRVGIEGGIKLLQSSAVKALSALKNLIMYPVKLLRRTAVSIAGIFGRGGLRSLAKIKNLAKQGFEGVVKRLQNAAISLITRSKNLIMAPIRFVGRIASSIGGKIMEFFGKGASKEAGKLAGGAAKGGFLKPILGRIGKFLKPLLKKIPLVGTAISLGFAYSRFKKGDWVGGLIDVASALAALVPGVGTVLSLAIDAFGAFLDVKAGGADKEAGAKKAGMLGDWAKKLGKWVFDKVKDLPIIGSLINTVYHITKGKWKEAFISLGHIVPGIGLIMDLLGVQETDTTGVKKDNMLTGWVKNLGQWIADNIEKIPFLNSLYRSIVHFSAGQWAEGFKSLGHAIPLIDSILSIFGVKETDSEGKTVDKSNFMQSVDLIGKLKDWVYENIFKKIDGWITDIYDWSVKQVTAVSDTVSSWFGGKKDDKSKKGKPTPPSPKNAPAGPVATPPVATPVASGKTPPVPTGPNPASKAASTKETKGQVAKAPETTPTTPPAPTLPIQPLPESTPPSNSDEVGINNDILKQIADNTHTTNDGIKILAQVMARLTQILEKQQSGNVFINGAKQAESQQIPSAAQVANSNFDSIRASRMRFGLNR